MFISKFNTLIRSKILWGAFAAIVCVSFVGAFTPGGGCARMSADKAGRIFGRNVSRAEFAVARWCELGTRARPPGSEEDSKLLNRRTWRRLALLDLARRWGVTVSERELTEDLAAAGLSDEQAYMELLARLEIPREVWYAMRGHDEVTRRDQAFQEMRRQNLVINKLVAVLQSVVFTQPADLEHQLTNMTDLITAQYVIVDPETAVTNVAVSENEARSFFNEHQTFFEIPEKISVRYAAFPISNYLENVNVSDFDVSDYYSNNIASYQSTNASGVVSCVALDDVKDTILASLKHDRAAMDAKRAAAELEIALIPDHVGKSPEFFSATAKFNADVHTTEFFSAREVTTNIDVSYDFTKSAFALDPSDPERWFSRPILGESAAYIIATNDRIAARMPEFEEIQARATALALEKARQKALEDVSRQIRESTEKAIAEGKTFAEAAREAGFNVATSRPFSAFDQTYNYYSEETNVLPYSDVLVPATMTLASNEVAKPVRVPEGMLLAYVSERQPGDFAINQSLRPNVRSSFDRSKAVLMFDEWAEIVLQDAQLEDLLDKEPDE